MPLQLEGMSILGGRRHAKAANCVPPFRSMTCPVRAFFARSDIGDCSPVMGAYVSTIVFMDGYLMTPSTLTFRHGWTAERSVL